LKLSRSNINIAITELILFLLLLISYIVVIVPLYGYMGFERDFSIGKFIPGVFLLLVFLMLGVFMAQGLFHSIWHTLFLLCFIPNNIYYFSSSGNIFPLLGYAIFLLTLWLFQFIKTPLIGYPFLPVLSNTRNLWILLLLSVALTIPYIIYFYPYMDFSNLMFKNIYEIRLKFRELNYSPFFGYSVAILARVLLPMLLIIAIYKRKLLIIVIVCISILLLFLASGAVKSIFIGIFCAIIFYYGTNFRFKLKLFFMIIFFFVFFGIFEYFLFGTSYLTNLPVRRLFFIPPYLEDFYYSYFNENYTLYSHSFLKIFGGSNFPEGITRFVGEHVIGKGNMNANVGIIPDGFLSLGWTGVVFHSVIISFLFKFLSDLKMNPMFFGVIFIYIYYLNTSLFGTYLFTHGFLFLVILSFFCLKDTVYNYGQK